MQQAGAVRGHATRKGVGLRSARAKPASSVLAVPCLIDPAPGRKKNRTKVHNHATAAAGVPAP